MAHTTHKTAFAAKRGVASPRLVRMLGAGARLCSNDEPDEEIDRGPLPEVSESDWAAFEVARTPGKAEAWHQRNDAAAAALDLQHLDAMRRAGL